MILIVDLCWKKDSLSSDEFVLPIARIVAECGESCIIRHYTEAIDDVVASVDGAILCGTPLKDNDFLAHPDHFAWIRQFPHPLLGICAGMEVLAVAFGGTVLEEQEIGMTEVRCTRPDPLCAGKERFSAYALHRLAIPLPEEFIALARSDRCIQAIRHRSRPFCGVMFHPEVRNDWVIERFLDLCARLPRDQR
jgi:GMP synthase (glutamine-hydrolysing)